MIYQMSESGERLYNILRKDKCQDPQQVCQVLKNELEPVISSFISLSSPIIVRCRKFGEKLLFSVEIDAERIKNFGYIPR